MSELTVTVVAGELKLGDAWEDLVRRAQPNVFQHPAGTNAVSATDYGRTRTLLAWQGETLVGLWTLQESKIGPLRFLDGLPHRYSFVAGPVIDKAHSDRAIAAFFAAIAGDPSLPKVLHARFLDGGQDCCRALASASGVRRRATLHDRQRAYLTRDAGAKRSGSTRKKLRQDWNRLVAEGAVALVYNRDPADARAAFETFLAMEAKSWKGDKGTALVTREKDAAFVRQWFAGLADGGAASVALLTLDAMPVAAQVVLRQGTTAYTWKIAYDAAYEKFSPGVLLVDKLAEQLLDGDIEEIESCSPQGGFMEKIWSGRRRTVELLVEVGNRPTLAYPALMLAVLGHTRLRALYHRAGALRSSRRASKSVAAAT